MTVAFECRCGQKLRAAERAAGRSLACPACGRPVTVPAARPEIDDEDLVPVAAPDSPPAPAAPTVSAGALWAAAWGRLERSLLRLALFVSVLASCRALGDRVAPGGDLTREGLAGAVCFVVALAGLAASTRR